MALCGSAAAAAPVTMIKAGRLVDNGAGPAISPAMVQIEGERIAQVGTNLPVPADATVIRSRRCDLAPGIDRSAHAFDGRDGRALCWQDRVGSVEAGKFADLYRNLGGSAADIAQLRRVGFVMKGGVIYRDDLTRRQQ